MSHGLVSGMLAVVLAGATSAQAPVTQAPPPLRVVPDAGAEDLALKPLFESFEQAWNDAQADRLADLFDPSQCRVRSYTESFEGREGVRGWFVDALATRFHGSRIHVTSWDVQPQVRQHSNVAVDYEMTSAGGVTRRGSFDILVSNYDGEWRIRRLWAHAFDEKASTAGRPLRIGGPIREPKKIFDVKPVYPDVAKEKRVQGVIILSCVISPMGEVVEAEVLRGIPLLDQAAVDAVQQWRYEPTLVDGKPVPVLMTVTINFRLS